MTLPLVKNSKYLFSLFKFLVDSGASVHVVREQRAIIEVFKSHYCRYESLQEQILKCLRFLALEKKVSMSHLQRDILEKLDLNS